MGVRVVRWGARAMRQPRVRVSLPWLLFGRGGLTLRWVPRREIYHGLWCCGCDTTIGGSFSYGWSGDGRTGEPVGCLARKRRATLPRGLSTSPYRLDRLVGDPAQTYRLLGKPKRVKTPRELCRTSGTETNAHCRKNYVRIPWGKYSVGFLCCGAVTGAGEVAPAG